MKFKKLLIMLSILLIVILVACSSEEEELDLTEVRVRLSVKMEIEAERMPIGHGFSIHLVSYDYDTDGDHTITEDFVRSGSTNFGLSFANEGTFQYRVYQSVWSEDSEGNERFNIDEWIIGWSTFYITIVVTAEGRYLVADVSIVDSEGEEVSEMIFINQWLR